MRLPWMGGAVLVQVRPRRVTDVIVDRKKTPAALFNSVIKSKVSAIIEWIDFLEKKNGRNGSFFFSNNTRNDSKLRERFRERNDQLRPRRNEWVEGDCFFFVCFFFVSNEIYRRFPVFARCFSFFLFLAVRTKQLATCSLLFLPNVDSLEREPKPKKKGSDSTLGLSSTVLQAAIFVFVLFCLCFFFENAIRFLLAKWVRSSSRWRTVGHGGGDANRPWTTHSWRCRRR